MRLPAWCSCSVGNPCSSQVTEYGTGPAIHLGLACLGIMATCLGIMATRPSDMQAHETRISAVCAGAAKSIPIDGNMCAKSLLRWIEGHVLGCFVSELDSHLESELPNLMRMAGRICRLASSAVQAVTGFMHSRIHSLLHRSQALVLGLCLGSALLSFRLMRLIRCQHNLTYAAGMAANAGQTFSLTPSRS